MSRAQLISSPATAAAAAAAAAAALAAAAAFLALKGHGMDERDPRGSTLTMSTAFKAFFASLGRRQPRRPGFYFKRNGVNYNIQQAMRSYHFPFLH